jgi:hypothetical protein
VVNPAASLSAPTASNRQGTPSEDKQQPFALEIVVVAPPSGPGPQQSLFIIDSLEYHAKRCPPSGPIAATVDGSDGADEQQRSSANSSGTQAEQADDPVY